ncbi:hypothetical protein ACLB3Z_05975 [Escherichia coli]
MDYIQAVFAKRLNEHKQTLLNKNNNIKKNIIEHCKCELLVDFIKVTKQNDDSLLLTFPDLKLQIVSQEKFAFNDNKEVALQTSFYHDDEYIFSMAITHTGKVKFVDKFKEKHPDLDYDDTDIPLLLIHGILSAAHRNGTTHLIE